MDATVLRIARLSRRLAGLLFVLALVAGCARIGSRPAPKAVAGVLDLRNWDFQQNGSVNLDGQWEFFWRKTADELPAGRTGTYLHIPNSWTGQKVGGETLPAEGYATYRLRVLTPASAGALGVRTDSAGTAFTLLVNGKAVAGNGVVGTSLSTSRPEFRVGIADLSALPTSSEWVLTVSNYHYRKGGPWNSVRLGLVPDLTAEVTRQGQVELFLIGSLLIMGVYHLVIFGLRRQDRSALYYGLFCIDVLLRQATTGTRFVQTVLPFLPWDVQIRIEFITFFLAIVTSSLFVQVLFPSEMKRRPTWGAVAVGGVASVITVFAPPAWSSYLINSYQLWTLVMCAYILWSVGLAARRGRDGAWIFLIGATILVITTFNDVLYNLELFRLGYLIAYGLVAFNFAQAVLLSRRFIRAVVTAETLQATLEHKVEERTNELAAKNQELVATIEDLRTTRSQLKQVGLSLRIGADYVVFPYADVHYLTAREGKTVIHTPDREHEVARPLKEVEELLSTEIFQRIHRQCIVNVSQVTNVAHIGSGGYIAVLRGRADSPLPVSRVHAPLLKQRLGIVG